MSEFVRVGRVDEFREGRGRAVRVGRERVAVFRLDGRLYALGDACPHMGASLADGKLEGCRVVCHWHGWRFDLETGQGDQRQWACARVYPVRVEGDEVWLRPPDEATDEAAPATEEDWSVWDAERYFKDEPGEDR